MSHPTIIKPTPKQCEAAIQADKHLVTLYGGAIRGGKSYWLLLLIFTYAMKHDKSRWALVRATYTALKSTLIVTFNKLLDEGLAQYVKSYNHTELVVTLTNGSQIIFFAENFDNDKDLNRFKGLEVNGFGLDECNELQEATFTKCIERAGSWQGSKGCPIKILMSCNPATNWVKEMFYDRWVKSELPENYCYIPSKITDNPHIDKNYIESLKSLPEHHYEVFVNGNWDMKVDGLLLPRSELRYFKPDPSRVFQASIAYSDIADDGDDSTSCPFAEIIDKDIYITSVIFDKNNSEITIPRTAAKIKEKGTKYIRVESNNMGAMYARNLKKEDIGGCQVLTAASTSNKHTRILMDAGDIKKYCVFLHPDYWDAEYKSFMQELTNYLQDGSSKHDDANDSMSGLIMFLRGLMPNIFK